ncbi:hypothetical protein Q2T42_27140 [Leptolyngbya boryana CZ1]|uniref:RiboL-PSP-HEPN domain-containing protein n=1 Tax=Leptolyngbya boryana CZ1 TaxID=3060204 RepID=A0AA96X4M1_LEPBY|nr:hypothetical protein [Leptolyngbya boryana]WNZ45470.1 hypothetical protein Q2T42_27140 [Leptolyngbya boryana CZ1]
MFLVQDSSTAREARIQQLSVEDPTLSALLAVIHVEWTFRRAIIALGTSPNVDIRKELKRCHGLDNYKESWKVEVSSKNNRKRLPEVVKNWDGLRRSFSLRHRLVHGVSGCGHEYAQERTNWALAAAADVREFCSVHNVDLDSRLPVRRKKSIAQS